MQVYGSKRGCGVRAKGGIYAITRAAMPGEPARPVDDFLICPPFLPGVDVPMQGMKAIEINGIVHALDFVGQEHYPSVPEFIREVAALGVSRRIPKTFPFSRLTPGKSKMIMVHPRAYVWDVPRLEVVARSPCPKGHKHSDPQEMCIKDLWWAVEGGELLAETSDPTRRDTLYQTDPSPERAIKKVLPYGGALYAHRPPARWHWSDVSAAVFATFPIHEFHVIQGDHGEHTEALDIVDGTGYKALLADR